MYNVRFRQLYMSPLSELYMYSRLYSTLVMPMVEMSSFRSNSATTEEEHSSFYRQLTAESLEQFQHLMDQATACLREAKQQHDVLEGFYVENMDFQGIAAMEQEVQEKIHQSFCFRNGGCRIPQETS